MRAPLSVEEIRFIDNYLIDKKIEYIDVRLELIDHLASEYEENSEGNLLEDFLKSKRFFILDFVENRQKKIHWSYQKQLWTRLAMFFYKPKYVFGLTLLFICLSFFILKYGKEIGISVLLIPVFVLQVVPYFSYYIFNKSLKKIQSAQSLLSIMSLPFLFLPFAHFIKGVVLENQFIFICYVLAAFLFNISGLLEVLDKKKKIIKRYKSILE